MAYITNVQLTVSAIGGGSVENKAEVKCTINFLNEEVVANQDYMVRAWLWESDETRDIYGMRPSGVVTRTQARGDPDDPVGAIAGILVRPNGQATIDVTLSREWTFPDLDDISPTMEKFFATVSVIPLLAMGDWVFSPYVDLDVG